MQRSREVKSGVSIRATMRALYRRYDNDRAAVEAAIAELTERPEMLEAWATRCIRNEDAIARAFSFTELPGGMREAGKRAIAVAFLTSGVKA